MLLMFLTEGVGVEARLVCVVQYLVLLNVFLEISIL